MSYAGRNCAEYDAFERERRGILNCEDADCSECNDPECDHICHVRSEMVDDWGHESSEEPCDSFGTTANAETP
jgi:hypothetical protein